MLPELVLDLLRRQRGALADRQLLALEPPDRRRVRRHPELVQVSSRTWRHLAVPPSAEQRLILSVLDAGADAALWGKSGASHWGFSRYRRLPAHVGVTRTRLRGPRLAQVHRIRDLDPHDIVTHLDVPTCRPERIILWLAGMMTHRLGHEVALERMKVILDQAWRQRLIDGHAIHALAECAGGKGRSGIVVLRQLLEERPPDYQPAGSRLEERFEESLTTEVRRQLVRQVTVDAEVVIRTVDYKLKAWPLIAEINSEVFHSSFADRTADAERYDRLLDMGYSVVVWWEYDVWNDPGTIRRYMDHLLRNPDPEPTLHRPTKAPWEV
jgi:very-short-patch-repair endonuclease